MKNTEKIERVLGELRILTEQGKVKWEVYKDAFDTDYKSVNFTITMPDEEEDHACWAFLINEGLVFLFDVDASPYQSDLIAQFHSLLGAIDKAENTADIKLEDDEQEALDKAVEILGNHNLLN